MCACMSLMLHRQTCIHEYVQYPRTYVRTYLPTCLPTFLPTYIHTSIHHPSIHPPTHPPSHPSIHPYIHVRICITIFCHIFPTPVAAGLLPLVYYLARLRFQFHRHEAHSNGEAPNGLEPHSSWGFTTPESGGQLLDGVRWCYNSVSF